MHKVERDSYVSLLYLHSVLNVFCVKLFEKYGGPIKCYLNYDQSLT